MLYDQRPSDVNESYAAFDMMRLLRLWYLCVLHHLHTSRKISLIFFRFSSEMRFSYGYQITFLTSPHKVWFFGKEVEFSRTYTGYTHISFKPLFVVILLRLGRMRTLSIIIICVSFDVLLSC